ncbi:LON peptidase substrate-binding domain-containing protein [Ferrimonas pelagia]|uniref:LON peptidase substrate-binding domain-containing protein n=1 Tax=Ferrimonas pelagia TaxID=1177826 RepID=A0ABP9FC86_9GAMM
MADYPNIPLFPLPSLVLPGGKLRLRIFEARYLRMVRESFNADTGFAICLLDDAVTARQPAAIYPLATRVRIVDFTALEDGLLGITVEGLERLEVHQTATESDGLRLGTARALTHWPPQPLDEQQQRVAQQLSAAFDDYPELATLYPSPQWADASWVAQRWLELLPLTNEEKQRLTQKSGPNPTLTRIAAMMAQ